jgi:MFS transporter, ACS family, allantoate permease
MDTEKIHDASSEDPEKVAELTPKATLGDGEVIDEMFKHADPNDGDEALLAFQAHDGETIVMTPEMEKKLLRKIDLNLMPVCNIIRIRTIES